jgi:hypothetical protein
MSNNGAVNVLFIILFTSFSFGGCVVVVGVYGCMIYPRWYNVNPQNAIFLIFFQNRPQARINTEKIFYKK